MVEKKTFIQWDGTHEVEHAAGVLNSMVLFVITVLVPAIQTGMNVDLSTMRSIYAARINDEIRGYLNLEVDDVVPDISQFVMQVDVILRERYNVQDFNDALKNGIVGEERVAWLNGFNLFETGKQLDQGDVLFGVIVPDEWQKTYSTNTKSFEWYEPSDDGLTLVDSHQYSKKLGLGD